MRKALTLAWLSLMLASTPALAHKLRLFAQTEGDWINGRVYYVGGSPAAGARIEVRDAEDRLLAELSPDADGRFRYRIQAPTEHRLIAITSDGHRAEQRLVAAPLPVALPQERGGIGPAAAAQPDLDPALLALIDQTLARQTQPLAERLEALEGHIRLQDILGGIGYILGLTGLALWWRCRRARP